MRMTADEQVWAKINAPGCTMSRGRMIAYLVMLVLIAKHLLADSYGPWDRLLEIGVFLFIAYEVIVGTVRHRRTTRRQGKLKQIVTSLSQLMNTGRKLQRSVPDTAKEESGVLSLWMTNTNTWGDKVNEFLAACSPQASEGFLLVHDSSSADSLVFTPSGDFFYLASPIREHYQRLLTQLNNLRHIIGSVLASSALVGARLSLAYAPSGSTQTRGRSPQTLCIAKQASPHSLGL